jgi:hypothetical protein
MPVKNECIEVQQTSMFNFFGRSALRDRHNRCARHLAEHSFDQSNHGHHDVSDKKSVIGRYVRRCLGALRQPEVTG